MTQQMKDYLTIGLLSFIALVVTYDAFIKKDKVKVVRGDETQIAQNQTQPQILADNNSPFSTNANTEYDEFGNVVGVNTSINTEAFNAPPTKVSFTQSSHNFGNIKQDTENKHIFKFTNTGDKPLIIENAQGSCGCTVPKYPREPIAPGKTGEIEVEYKPGKQQGAQTKTVTITANTEPKVTTLQISAFVEE
jgi:hypothetical protein